MNRVLLEPAEQAPDGTATLTDRRARHILETLKPALGQPLRIGLSDGPAGNGVVQELAPDRVVLACAFDAPPPPPACPVTLVLAVPRPKVLKRLWAPLASLGVARVAIVNAAKVERAYFATHWLRPAHIRPRLIEGLEQAGLTRLPLVTIHRRLRPFVEDELPALAPGARLLAHPGADRRLRDALSAPPGPACLAVGPEGGWTEFELKLFESAGFLRIAAGTTPLRTDVACIALLALLQDALGHAG